MHIFAFISCNGLEYFSCSMVAPVFDPCMDMRLFLEGQMAKVAGRLCNTKPQASGSVRIGFEARPLPLTQGLALSDAEDDFFRLFQYKLVAGEYGGISRAMNLLADICELRRGSESMYFHPTEIFLLRLALEDCLKGVPCDIGMFVVQWQLCRKSSASIALQPRGDWLIGY